MENLVSNFPNTSSERFPIVLKKHGVKVSIYKCGNGGDYITHRVVWREGTVPKRASIADLEEAKTFAKETFETLKVGLPALSPKETGELLRFKKLEQKIAPATLEQLVESHLKSNGNGAHQPTLRVQEAVELFLQNTKDRQLSQRHIQTARSHLRRFAKNYPTLLTSIRISDINDHLKTVGECTRTKNNHRLTLVSFFNWCMKNKGLVHNPAKNSIRFKENINDPGIFTPEEMERLLANTDKKLIPFLSIGAFAGLRAAELCRLTWDHIDWDQKCIALPSKITKTGRRRIAFIADNLMVWLLPYREETGRIMPSSHPNRQTSELAERTGVVWKHNGLRHSYISYAMAEQRDAARVAEQSGNSESEVQRSYKAAVTPEQAKKWFAIYPRGA